MADITYLFGGPFVPPTERYIESVEVQFSDAMAAAGIFPPNDIILDGKVHRFGKDKVNWYCGFSDAVPAGVFGDWKQGAEYRWRADIGRSLTLAEEMGHAKRVAELAEIRKRETAKKHQVASDTVSEIWAGAANASPDHPYLSRKGIPANGSRVAGDGRLILPLLDHDGTLASLQYIAPDGSKRFHTGGAVSGMYWAIKGGESIYICEGFATASSIHRATNGTVYIAYSASNIPAMSRHVRALHKGSICIVADNDASGVGAKYANEAAGLIGARVVVIPSEGMDANDYEASGGNLADLLQPPRTDWLIQADDFSAAPAPVAWLVKNWIQDQALIMVHGPSGGGKTFVVLDLCLHIASEFKKWHGHNVRDGSVVYLAGEGHAGLRGRIAAWRQEFQPSQRLNMWLSRDGCDLNTPEGYARVVDNVRSCSIAPRLIVVDTLHRFLLGDENSAQDAKGMLDACGGLMQEFGCSVLLVHHTGVSEEAQTRARGSSAWRGALDIEISIIPSKDGDPMQIIQRKSKDAELAKDMFVELKSVPIDGWVDEDGEPTSSAVIVPSHKTMSSKKETPLDRHKKVFDRAWWASGCEVVEGAPYVSRSALVDFLINNDGLSEASAVAAVKPSRHELLVGNLINSEIVVNKLFGWVVIDGSMAASMMIRLKNG